MAGEAEVAWACGRACEGLIRELEGGRWVRGGLVEGLLGSLTFSPRFPPPFFFSLKKTNVCLHVFGEALVLRDGGATCFPIPEEFFCKNCEVFVGIGVLVEEIND